MSRQRCGWAGSDPLYCRYHDEEWGRPVGDDRRLFEKLCLEGFQSGLSWITILRKRERFRRVFHGFDMEPVAAMGEGDVERLLGDAGIIRHRGKIKATIGNAGAALVVQREFGSLAAFVWQFEPKLRSDRRRSRANGCGPIRCRRHQRPCLKLCASTGFRLLAPPPAMLSCRRWGWSTTMSRGASAGSR